MARGKKKDELLSHPLLTDDEVKSLLEDVEAIRKGKIKTIVGTDFWHRAMAEMTRRQANLQVQISQSLASATWGLVIVTLLLVIVTVAVTLLRTK